MSQNSADQKPSTTSQSSSAQTPLLSAPQFTSALKSFQGQAVAFLALVLLLGGVWYFANDAGAPAPDVAEADAKNTLTGMVWIWKESATNGATSSPRLPGDSAVVFEEEGRLYLDTDCNTYRGGWTATGTDMLMVTVEPTSNISCPQGSMAAMLSASMSGALTHRIENGMLILTANDGTTAIFEASGYLGTFTAEEEGASVMLSVSADGNVVVTNTTTSGKVVEEGMWGTGNGGNLLATLTTRNGAATAPVTVVFEETENGVRGISPAAFVDVALVRATTTIQQ